MRCEL